MLPILTAPHPALKEMAKPISSVDEAIRSQMDNMLETMYANSGIGLAGNQVNILNRVLVMDLNAGNEITERTPIFMANPEVIWMSDEPSIWDEGCLSVPQQFAEVERSRQVRVKFLNYDGKEEEQMFEDLASHCVQHEIDHLDGKLFVDHLSRLKRNMLLRKLDKYKKSHDIL